MDEKAIIARYDGNEFPVEDADLEPNDFKEVLATEFPELTNATVRVTETEEVIYWDYAVVAGQKG